MTMILQTEQHITTERMVNPFATRWVRPGVLPYRFSNGKSAEQVVRKLENNGWRGAIVGPHGTGKSTLLVEIRRHVESGGREVELIALHDGQRRMPANFWQANSRNPRRLMIVDGFEQLGWWSRRRLLQVGHRHGGGLLITAHRTDAIMGLPVIHQTNGDLATVQYLIDHSLPWHGGAIEPCDVSNAFRTHAGNVRETMFALYELFEQRRRETQASVRASPAPVSL